jgi:hypothetical protein
MKSLEEIFASLTSQEAFFQERVDEAIKKAKKIVNNELTTEQDLVDRMKFLVSSHYNMPYHAAFFDDLTVDELLLEVMIISESKKEPEARAGEIIKENIAEAEDAFGDLMDTEELEVPEQFSQEEKDFINKQGSAFKQGGFAALNKQS